MTAGMRLSSFGLQDADRWGEELESVLTEAGLTIAAGSELERICLAPAEILSYEPGQEVSSEATYRQFVDASALAELANRLLLARPHPSFQTLLGHLKLLNQGDPRQAGRARSTDQIARKLFELFVALLAMRFSEKVDLEDPVHGSDGNPDVTFELDGCLWGVACKVPTSSHRESLIQNLIRAVDQVVESGVDRGFPMFNLKNVVSPEALWREDLGDSSGRSFVFFRDPRAMAEHAIAEAHAVWRTVRDHVGQGVFASTLRSPPCAPVVLSYLHVLAPVILENEGTAMTSRFIACFHIDEHSDRDSAVIQSLHGAAREEWGPGRAL